METPASIRKHPIHPALVSIPIGLWVFALVCDLIFVWGTRADAVAHTPNIWWSMAFYTLAGGIIGALLAAVFGLVDLISIRDPHFKRTGVTHMLLNLVVVAIMAASLYLRTRVLPGAATPVVLNFVGILVLLVSGWLGAELVHIHGVSVSSEFTGTHEEPGSVDIHPQQEREHRRTS